MADPEQVTKTVIVKADVSQAYTAWENFENFPAFMDDIQSVENRGNGVSHWKMKGPLGVMIEWDAEMTRNEPNKRIAWNSKDNENSDLTTSGQVVFTPLPDNETQVTVTLQYKPKLGLAGDVVDKLVNNPEKRLDRDLKKFKEYVERGGRV